MTLTCFFRETYNSNIVMLLTVREGRETGKPSKQEEWNKERNRHMNK